MGYYQSKVRMQEIVKERIKRTPDGVERKALVFDMIDSFGFSEKSIERYIELLAERGKIEGKAVLTWINTKS